MATYTDLATYRNSSDFNDRCRIAVATYANYIIGEATTVASHNRRFLWATSAITNCAGIVSQLCDRIVLDPIFTGLANGTPNISSLTDAQIQSAVQTAIDNTLLAY